MKKHKRSRSSKSSYFGHRNPSNQQHDFGKAPRVDIQRSVFNRSHGHKTTFDSGYLVPVFVDEALPGDTFHLTTSILARLSTPIVPFMDNLKLDIHYFSVPCRLLWDNWQRFMGEQDNPGDSTDYLVPQIYAGAGVGANEQTLWDYFGLPTRVHDELSVNALPFRAYNLIYNEWYRDQNLIDSAPVNKGDGREYFTSDQDYQLRRRCKRHDYFTSCLPWPQKGDGVELALGTPTLVVDAQDRPVRWERRGDSPRSGFAYDNGIGNEVTSSDGVIFSEDDAGTDDELSGPLYYPDDENFGLSISNTDALTINSLRTAFQLQRMLERDARGGTRYTEIIRAHFGVISPDSRVQRPEYLGGGTFDININPVMQTSSTDDISPQGNLSAFGVTSAVGNGFSHSFVEHCIVIGIASVRADLTYQQGIPRMFSRETKYDYYWPVLSHLGEQAVLNKEIYAQGVNVLNDNGTPIDDDVFGYQERNAEYRYAPSKITGKMRSTDPQPLDQWHLSQKFETLPTLSQEFIEEHPPLARVLAVQDEPQILADFFFNMRCARPMPTYSVPGYIDHF